MSEAAASPGAAPAANPNLIEALPPKPPKRSNLFTEVDSAVDEALAKGEAKPAKRTGPPTKSERRSAEREVDDLLSDGSVGFPKGDRPDDEPEEDAPLPRKRAKPQEDAEPEQETRDAPEEEEGADDEEPLEPEEGTKKKPYKREDMPEDRFVEVKANGEKHVVSLRELTDSWSGQKAIQQQLNKIGEERSRMERHVTEAKEEVKKNGAYFEDLISTPQKLYDLLTSNDKLEAVLQDIFTRRWNDLDGWQKNPAARAKFLYDRGQRHIQRQHQQLQAEQQRVQREQEAARQEQHRMRVLKPGWDEGLRRAKLTGMKQLPPELVQTAQLKLNQRAEQLGNEPVTSEDVAEALVFAARFHNIRPENAPPPPTRKPIIPPRNQQQRRTPANEKQWEGMTRARKSMDPDWLMRGTRVR